MNINTSIKKLAFSTALFGGIGAAALGIGTGLAQADSAMPGGLTLQAQSYDRGDQEVVPRGHPIPVHGDDSGTHVPGSARPAPTAGAVHNNAPHHGE
ncbi:hypothetical protein [Mycobacterium sp. EPa45]|uniref:hypothetical protein n=1 Tax=Mycobacterium sp. EPa45 TaxID=1545728 RepID=UPI0006426DC8|nr:hypothetical protein [Mycobacterium sp. EPa45]AKK28180.1 hypothetical protein AB431_17500 [Mycobacterium sp. EPa45]